MLRVDRQREIEAQDPGLGVVKVLVTDGGHERRRREAGQQRLQPRRRLLAGRGLVLGGVRIEHPHLNDFPLAPLAKSAGGTEACGQAVFANPHDPDYQAVLQTFDPIRHLLQTRPRMDMPGAVSTCDLTEGLR